MLVLCSSPDIHSFIIVDIIINIIDLAYCE